MNRFFHSSIRLLPHVNPLGWLSVLCGLLSCPSVIAQEVEAECQPDPEQEYPAANININSHPIFDESAEDAIALHRWANALHVITKPYVIEERLSFDVGDRVSQEDIVEAEAILRAQRYLANAEISTRLNCDTETLDVDVETWDNWSLIPTLSFGRSGGQNSSLIGVREDNLLGWGVRATMRYSNDEQRSGYQMAFSSLVPWIRHANISVTLADNDDGEVYSVVLDKPFYHLNTENSLLARAVTIRQVLDVFQNDATRNSIAVDSEEFTLGYGWRLSANNRNTRRFTMGLTRQKERFAVAPESPSQDPRFVPESRDFVYPWARFEYVERDIVVMQDIYFINQPEDINLGWQFSTQMGIEVDNDIDGMGLHTQLSVRKGFAFENSLFMLNSSVNAISNADITDFARFDANLEYFYRDDSKTAYYARASSTFSSGQFLDRPVVIDDENGVRGFPNQYQHGDHRYSLSGEVRWYADYNVYQLFEVGFAGFVDAGRAYGGEQARLNADGDLLASVGIGARLYSNKASNPGVVHIDIARPISSDSNVDNIEWSLTLRRSF